MTAMHGGTHQKERGGIQYLLSLTLGMVSLFLLFSFLLCFHLCHVASEGFMRLFELLLPAS